VAAATIASLMIIEHSINHPSGATDGLCSPYAHPKLFSSTTSQLRSSHRYDLRAVLRMMMWDRLRIARCGRR
jgi:hypothetical protein